MVIKSALVPVAGLGTRLLPATKSQPKEMLPVARKPIVQYVVEELVSNGIQQILFVTGRSKASIENHFDHDPELCRALADANKQDLLKELDFEAMKANFFYTRQRMQRGLGDAVLCGENFAGEEPFLVALGDSILGLNAVARAVGRMADVFESKRASCVIAVEEVPLEEVGKYGIRVNSAFMGWMWGAPVQQGIKMMAMMQKTSEEEVLKQIVANIPLGRMCCDDECARAALMLVSDYAKAITGACLDVNGGEYLP